MIGCRGALDKPPSCCKQKQCTQVLMDCHIWLVIPGHTKCSCNRDRVWSQPWCPASLWHPFRAVTQCTFGTTKSRRSSFLPLGIECRYRAFWWIVKFCWFHKISQPSSLEACSPISVFRSVFVWASNQSRTALSIGSSLVASAQSVMCIWTDMCPAVTWTSCSKSWSPSAMVGSWTSVWCAAPRVIPIEDGSHCVWVKVGSNLGSAHLPQCYCIIFGTLTGSWTLQGLQPHWWPVALRLGVIMI